MRPQANHDVKPSVQCRPPVGARRRVAALTTCAQVLLAPRREFVVVPVDNYPRGMGEGRDVGVRKGFKETMRSGQSLEESVDVCPDGKRKPMSCLQEAVGSSECRSRACRAARLAGLLSTVPIPQQTTSKRC